MAAFPNNKAGALRFLRARLHSAGSDAPDMEARIIIEKRLGLPWHDVLSSEALYIDAEQEAHILSDLTLREQGQPLSRIYGENEFWGLLFKLGEATLDPRQDSETLIDIALKRFDKGADIEILDMGTGSGCLLISLLYELKHARGTGSDISAKTLEIARQNGVYNGVDARVCWVESSWADEIDGRFDLVISNPPYIRSEVIPDLDANVREYDPILALDGGEDGLQAYKKIISTLGRLLKPDGLALFEIGFDQAEDVMRLGKESGFLVKGVHADLAGQPRVVEMSCGDK